MSTLSDPGIPAPGGTAPPPEPPPRHGMRFGAFVSLIAALMAVNALAVDSMLPALPQIGDSLGVTDGNAQQWVIVAYLLGFGVAQLFYGPLADRFGRRPVLLFGLVLYVLAATAAAFANSFDTMLAARVFQGIGAAATRVLAVAIVRDCYSGRQMARVMSLAFIVFLAVPVLAPSIGQLILLLGPWRWIFTVLMLFGAVVLVWAWARLPETLDPADRMPISAWRIGRGVKRTLTHRIALGYLLAMTLIMGGLFGYITSVQRIFAEVFDAEALFPSMFALSAGFMAVASLINSRIVGRLGTRRVSHGAMIGYLAFSILHSLVAWVGYETIWSFTLLQACTMFFFGLIGPNFGAMSMEPLGHIAGTASSVQGFVSMVGGSLLGFFVGQHFAGTSLPMTLGFSGYGLLALAVVLVTEHGRFMTSPRGPS